MDVGYSLVIQIDPLLAILLNLRCKITIIARDYDSAH